MYNILFTFILSFFTLGILQGQSIVINEFMASNATAITDEDGNYEDWIEIYNKGDNEIQLYGWGLSDDYSMPFKWRFPNITIGSGEFILIWASGKNRSGNYLHTNFSINSSGEEIILTEPSGMQADEISPMHLPTDISYGRYPDGSDNFYYYSKPTPGSTNTGDGYHKMLEKPVFSHEQGFYTDSFYLKVTHNEQGVVLRYTLDGSQPNSTSSVFPDSLLIYNRKNEPDEISAIPTTSSTEPEWYRWYPPMDKVFKGTNIRVKAFKDGAISPFTATNNYWVDKDIFQRYSLPVISIAVEQDDLFGSAGIYTNFNMRGMNWEREMHIAFFESDGSPGFATDAGIRVHGGNSRRYALKSFRIYFRNRYGESSINYPVFPQQEMNIHDRLILRNSGSDWAMTYFRDAFVQSLLHDFSDVETQAYRPAVVFINGEYWGIMNIRERFDNNYLKNHYGYEDIDLLENVNQVVYGSNEHYNNLLTFLRNNNLDDSENYNWVKSQMDVVDFRDYHILQIFSMNTDQPGKNVRFWRPQTANGRWRWMWWDMDDSFIFGDHNYYDRNGIKFCTGLDSISDPNVKGRTPPPNWAPNGTGQTFPLRALLGNTEFREDFISRFADLLNTAFQPEYLNSIVDFFEVSVKDYMYEHYRRWHRPTPERNQEHLQRLRDFSDNRIYYMMQHLEDFFELDGRVTLNINVSSGQGYIKINTIDLEKKTPSINDPVYPWQGVYFKGIPVNFTAIPDPGYVFSHWSGDIDGMQNSFKIIPDNDLSINAHFQPADDHELITFWYYNVDLPNNQPLEYVLPKYSLTENSNLYFQSCLEGYPYDETHQDWRKASMERRNQPTSLNYRPDALESKPYDDDNMRGLQIKQPFANGTAENKMVFELPTIGFKDILFSFAAKDEGAVDGIIIEYNVSKDNVDWITDGLMNSNINLTDDYQFYQIDFSDIPDVNNNYNFKIRIRFYSNNSFEDNGNRVTFNNISLDGIVMGDYIIYASASNNGSIYPSGHIPVTRNAELGFMIIPNHDYLIYDVLVDQESVLDDLTINEDNSAVFEFADISSNHNIHAVFADHPKIVNKPLDKADILIFPNPTNDKITVSSSEIISEIAITNITGNITDTYSSLYIKDFTIYINHLHDGFYIVRVHTDKGVVSKKLQIIR